MANFTGEGKKVVHLVEHGTAGYSQPVSLAGVQQVTIACGYVLDPVLPTSVANALASAANSATFSVLLGTAATVGASSFTAMTGATLSLGAATAGQLNNWDSVMIGVIGTAATGVTLTISHGPTTKAFTIQKNATLSDLQIGASNTTVFANCLASAINAYFPDLEITYETTVGSGDTIAHYTLLAPKTAGSGEVSVNVTANANTVSDVVMVQGHKQSGVINFKAADVVATSSSYTHFAVLVDSSATTVKASAFAILDYGHDPQPAHKTNL